MASPPPPSNQPHIPPPPPGKSEPLTPITPPPRLVADMLKEALEKRPNIFRDPAQVAALAGLIKDVLDRLSRTAPDQAFSVLVPWMIDLLTSGQATHRI